MRSLTNANISGLVSIVSSFSCEWLIGYLCHSRIIVGVRINSKKEKCCCKGCDKASVTKQGVTCASLCGWVSSLSQGEHQLRAELLSPRRAKWNLPGFGLLPCGWEWLDVRKDSSPPRISIKRPHLLLCMLEATFSSTFAGCTWAFYYWLYFPLSHPGCLSLLFFP